MEKDKKIELYKLIVEEEHYFLSEHQKRISFYTGLLTALTGGTVVGFLSSKMWYHYLLLLLGPITIIGISVIAKLGIRRLYQRFLESITVRAKLEQDLEMTKYRSTESSEIDIGWVEREPLITKRHMDSRKDPRYKTSMDWVQDHLSKRENYHGVTIRLFNYAIFLGIVMFVLALMLSGIFWVEP
jgi:hypothetical protein